MTAFVHCSYHKCLMVYYQQVMTHLLGDCGRTSIATSSAGCAGFARVSPGVP